MIIEVEGSMETALISVIGTLLVLLLSHNTKRLNQIEKKVDSVKVQVDEINGSIKEVRMWEKMHEGLDVERFSGIKEEITELRRKIDHERR